MKKILFYGFIMTGLFACSSNQNVKNEKVTNSVYITSSDDEEMDEAIVKAKSTIAQFDKALQSNNYDTSTFALKIKFATSAKDAEYIWATSVIMKSGDYYGIVDNLPELTTKVEVGKRIKLNKENISDWVYGDKGILRGGYTIKLVYKRMPKEEQDKFDANFPFKIVD